MASPDSSIFQESAQKLKGEKVSFPSLNPSKPPRMLGMKSAIFMAFMLSFASLAAGGFLYQTLTVERKERTALEAASIQLQDRVEGLQGESNKYREEIARMREQLKAHARERNEWKKQLDESYADNSKLQEKIDTLEERLSQVEQNAPVAQASTLGEIPGSEAVGNPAALPASPPAVAEPGVQKEIGKTFQVLTVNRKFNFVVVNLGMKDLVKMGDTLSVERDGQRIGSVQIEKLYDRFAAAIILEESKESPITEGDLVRKT
jgi:cell shape-determining protein MreC